MRQLLRIGRNTVDLDRAIAFHRDALGFRLDDGDAAPPTWTRLPGIDARPVRCALLSLGAQHIELTEFPDAAPCPADSAACDLWFQHCAIVVDDMHAAHERVMAHGASAITRDGPQTLPPSTGSVTAFKFRDPDGHPLELIAFPEGAGDPVWQSARMGGPTLGIDHGAISVADAGRSIRFYALAGLQRATRGLNRGIEQQRLDALADVEVDVVAMHGAARTPHLELLGYRRPRGRAMLPTGFTAVAADRCIWLADTLDALQDGIDDGGFADAVVASGSADGTAVALLCDPDGHLLVLRDHS